MSEKKGIIKVRVWLPLTDNAIMIRHEDASFTPSPEFKDAIETEEEKFREPIITFINDAIGLYNWTVRFTQFDETGKIFECGIKANSIEEYQTIIAIVKERIKHVEIRQFMYLGQL